MKTMGTKAVLWNRILHRLCFPRRWGSCSSAKGQALVEFTLVFILLLIIAWIPADFGLAFYTGQIAQNAAREGARIAAADPTMVPGTCNMPACMTGANILRETGLRLPAALLTGASVTVQYPSPDGPSTGCNQLVKVSVTGNYNFFFYQVLRLVNTNVPNSTPITRHANMRWEYNSGCVPSS
jgi:Flp pilus assembly protein TadG